MRIVLISDKNKKNLIKLEEQTQELSIILKKLKRYNDTYIKEFSLIDPYIGNLTSEDNLKDIQFYINKVDKLLKDELFQKERFIKSAFRSPKKSYHKTGDDLPILLAYCVLFEACYNSSENIEKLRLFLMPNGELSKFTKEHNIEFHPPIVPLTQSTDTNWYRKCKNSKKNTALKWFELEKNFNKDIELFENVDYLLRKLLFINLERYEENYSKQELLKMNIDMTFEYKHREELAKKYNEA